ncbi:MAG: ribosome small subunit-dependent GTPase A [Bacteroidota bacterium]
MHCVDCEVARVSRVDRDRYLVRSGDAEVQAEATGKLLFGIASAEDLPCVGDWVLVRYYNDGALAIIHEVFPRRTILRRKSAGKNIEFQSIASNVDVAFIMQSCDANFNLRRMERYLVIAREGRLEPVILLSKCDLVDAGKREEMLAGIRRAHIEAKVIPFSNTTGVGLDEVRRMLHKGKTYCLLGSSGVGKTTLLNHLIGAETFETASVRERDGRGRHITARRQLVVLDSGAIVIDTPGMRELGMMGAEAGIAESFPEISGIAEKCRFSDCTHTSESGCAVLAALERGELSEERYQSYLKLMKESAFHEMSYVERRRKDKQFGRMINKALKLVKKK